MLNLDWMITAPSLAELYPATSGQLRASGQLRGTPSAPEIKARLSGKMLSMADYKINSLESKIAVDLFNWQEISIKLAAQSLKLKDYTLKTLNIDADSQHLNLTAVSKLATTRVEVAGNIEAQNRSRTG